MLSFERIFEEQSDFVWSMLRRFGVRSADLEDVTHEVFIAVHRRLADYDHERPVRPWLFGIAYRTALRYKDLARHHREVHDVDTEWEDATPNAHEQLMDAERRRLFHRALLSVELDRRVVFLMHDLDEVPMPDVASELGIPLNTAYSRLRLARAEMKTALERARKQAAREDRS